jgi:hypothetical protein
MKGAVMPTLSEAARVTVKNGAVWRNCGGCGTLAALPPDIDQCTGCRIVAELRALAPFFATDALADIADAGCVFAGALADIVHNEIGEAGGWDCYGSVPDELVRLHAALDRLDTAIKASRAGLAGVERRARRAQRAAGWSA